MTKADDVPRALAEQACTISLAGRCIRIECDKREEAEELLDWLCSHEPAPVDPLREVFKEVTGVILSDAELRTLRARSVTLDSKGEGA